MSAVIQINNLGKRYRIGEIDRRMLYMEIQSWWARLRGKEDPNSLIVGGRRSTQKGDFWALRNVTFDVNEGDVVGVIGKNGSGKSTLLKILSEITTPTEGQVLIKGSVASLLEVGTGFHNELTGHENVYLNGSILGMSRAEIDSRYDAIVDFAGVSEFMHTPVKRYSSGMKLRLAFAVAAHLDPEVLILDEVLAVGDASFQQKCLGRIGEVARSGRTILFVSHNMAAVQSLCNKGVVLSEGRLVFAGSADDAVSHYMEISKPAAVSLRERTDRSGSGEVRLVGIDLKDDNGKSLHTVAAGGDVNLCLTIERQTDRHFENMVAGIVVKNQFDIPVFVQRTPPRSNWPRGGKILQAVCRLEQLPLVESTYRIDVRLRSDTKGQTLDQIESATEFHIERSDFFGLAELSKNRNYTCLVRGEWRLSASS